ncbi:unnamed protein product [Rangifer tarandus platyrhynchus]|uniref:Uncharacterized protein n=2 Tax=Rangifer tarandus platyrhynchus TaxID=3082113 RepID=A0ABN8Z8M8_RANTA|nr:unnamed protein product [Rangifer tarandus platyrhynchus]
MYDSGSAHAILSLPPPATPGAPSSPKCQGVWLWDVTTRSRRMVVHRQPPLLSVGDLLEEDASSHSTARSKSLAQRAPPERERGRNDGVDLAFCGTSSCTALLIIHQQPNQTAVNKPAQRGTRRF